MASSTKIINTAFIQQCLELLVRYNKNYNGISRRHWKSIRRRLRCYNRACYKQFTLNNRPRHCKKCGEVFCLKCLSYKRKLNKKANFDANGKFYKVCKTCFERGKTIEGETRSHTHEFEIHRRTARLQRQEEEEQSVKESEKSGVKTWRSKFDLDRECLRLVEGFQGGIGNSGVSSALSEMKCLFSTPDWMKSTVWAIENMMKTCQICREKVGRLTRKLWCRLCGIVVCINCSSEDLLLYIPDDERGNTSMQAQLVIIKLVGSPTIQPEISVHLRVCNNCRDKLTERQLNQYSEDLKSKEEQKAEAFMEQLIRLHDRFMFIEERVQTHMQKNDYADARSHYVTMALQLRDMEPCTPKQSKLLRKYIKAKCDFFETNILPNSSKSEVRDSENNVIPHSSSLKDRSEYNVTHLSSQSELRDLKRAESLDCLETGVE